jgi:hypothetical protein
MNIRAIATSWLMTVMCGLGSWQCNAGAGISEARASKTPTNLKSSGRRGSCRC